MIVENTLAAANAPLHNKGLGSKDHFKGDMFSG